MFHKQLAHQPLTSKQFPATAMSHKQLAQRLHAHKQIGQHSRLAARAKSREFSSPRLLGRNKEFQFCTSHYPQASTAPFAPTTIPRRRPRQLHSPAFSPGCVRQGVHASSVEIGDFGFSLSGEVPTPSYRKSSSLPRRRFGTLSSHC